MTALLIRLGLLRPRVLLDLPLNLRLMAAAMARTNGR